MDLVAIFVLLSLYYCYTQKNRLRRIRIVHLKSWILSFSYKILPILLLLIPVCRHYPCDSARTDNFFDKLFVIGHRGAGEDAEIPPNTLKSIRLGISQGVDAVDLDIQTTRDNIPVLFHTKFLQESSDWVGTVSQFNYGTLKNMYLRKRVDNYGSNHQKHERAPLASFEDAVSMALDAGIKLTTELKTHKAIKSYASMHRQYPILYNMTLHCTFDYFIAYWLKSNDANFLTCVAFRRGRLTYTRGDLLHRKNNIFTHPIWLVIEMIHDWLFSHFIYWFLGVDAIMLEDNGVTKEILDMWHSRGIRVIAFVVDDPERKTQLQKWKLPYVTNRVTHHDFTY